MTKMPVSIQEISEIIKVIGLVTGGLWAAWTFHKLQRVRAAELENNQRLAEIQKSRIEQEEIRARLLRQQPQLAIQIDVAEAASMTKTCKSLLCVKVILKNEGEQNLRVIFEPSALTVGRIVFEKDGIQNIIDVQRFGPSYFDANNDDPQVFRERIILAGQQRQMALAVLPVVKPGCYIVQFHAVYGRVPFGGEKPSGKEPFLIDAIEQTFYFATGEPNKSYSTA
jgi:hypothetical protein